MALFYLAELSYFTLRVYEPVYVHKVPPTSACANHILTLTVNTVAYRGAKEKLRAISIINLTKLIILLRKIY